MTPAQHTWEDCPMCGKHVRCGHCGNNCCNGGTGTLPGGEDCGCDEAYEIQDEGYAAAAIKAALEGQG